MSQSRCKSVSMPMQTRFGWSVDRLFIVADYSLLAAPTHVGARADSAVLWMLQCS